MLVEEVGPLIEPVRPDPGAAPAPRTSRALVALVVICAIGLAAGVVGFVASAVSQPPTEELQVEEVLARLQQAGTTCTLADRPKQGSGGKPFATAADDYWFAPCTTADGTVFAVVTYQPDQRPTGVPCARAEGTIDGQGSWWIHQAHRGEAAGGLDVPQRVDRAALAAIAEQLDGRFVDAC